MSSTSPDLLLANKLTMSFWQDSQHRNSHAVFLR